MKGQKKASRDLFASPRLPGRITILSFNNMRDIPAPVVRRFCAALVNAFQILFDLQNMAVYQAHLPGKLTKKIAVSIHKQWVE